MGHLIFFACLSTLHILVLIFCKYIAVKASLQLYGLPLTTMIVPTRFPSLSRSQVQLYIFCLPPRYERSMTLGLSCHAGPCCSSEASQLGRTVSCLSPLKALVVISGTMKAVAQEGSFQVRSVSGPWGSHFRRTCGVSSKWAYLPPLQDNQGQ